MHWCCSPRFCAAWAHCPGGAGAAAEAAWGAVVARQTFSRLWVAVISRHSEWQAALPRRWKRSILRLNLVSPKTGSIIAVRFRESSAPVGVASTRRMNEYSPPSNPAGALSLVGVGRDEHRDPV